jgi:hypothetical protein
VIGQVYDFDMQDVMVEGHKGVEVPLQFSPYIKLPIISNSHNDSSILQRAQSIIDIKVQQILSIAPLFRADPNRPPNLSALQIKGADLGR